MKEYGPDNRHKRRKKKSQRRALHGFIQLFLVVCCCLAVIILINNNFSFATDKQPNAHLSKNTETDTDVDTGSAADEKNHVDETAWCLILVNKWHAIPDDYEVELQELANGQSVDKRIYPALQEMFDTARSNGVYPIVASGYRTTEEQQRLMDEKIAAYRADGYSTDEAISKAEEWVSVPGTSEHQLGIAVDINADGIHSTGDDVYAWLNQNAYKFGLFAAIRPIKRP